MIQRTLSLAGQVAGKITPGTIAWTAVSAAVIYPVLFLWTYKTFVVPRYELHGQAYHAPEHWWLLATGWVFAVLPVTLLVSSKQRPASFLVWSMYLFAYVPSQLVPGVSVHQGRHDRIASTGSLRGNAGHSRRKSAPRESHSSTDA